MSQTTAIVAKGTSILTFQSMVSGAFRMINIIILARLLAQSEMGQLAFLAIIYGFVQFLGALGLNHASPLVIPEAEVSGGPGLVRSFLKRSLVLILLSSMILVSIIVVLSPFLTSFGSIDIDLLYLLIIIAPFSAMEVFLDSVLLSMYTIRSLATGRTLFDLTRVLLTVSFVVIGMGLTGVLLGWLAGEVLVVALFGIVAIRGTRAPSKPMAMGPVLGFAIPSMLFQLIDVTIQNTDRLILLHITDLSTLGVYDVVLGILFMMSFLSFAVSMSLYPVLTKLRLDESEDTKKDEATTIAVGHLVRYISIMLFPLAIIATMNSERILFFLFGISYSSYPAAALSFSILLIVYVFWGITYAFHTVLRSMGEIRFFIAAGIGIIIVEIFACWYLTILYGLLGAVLVRVVYVMLLFAISYFRLRQRGIHLTRTSLYSISKIICASFLAALIVYLTSPDNIIFFILLAFAALVFYILCLFGIREIKAIDFKMLRILFPKKSHKIINRIETAYLKDESSRDLD